MNNKISIVPYKLSIIILIIVFLLSPILRGSIGNVTIIIESILILLSFILYGLKNNKSYINDLNKYLVYLLIIQTILITIQMIPIPDIIFKSITNKNVELSGYYNKYINSYSNITITADLPATSIELIKAISILCIFIIVSNISPKQHKYILAIINASGFIIIINMIIHNVIIYESINGFILGGYIEAGNIKIFSPYLNKNNLASFMGITSFLSIYSFNITRSRYRYYYILYFIVSTIILFLTLSRGSITSFILCIILLMLYINKTLLINKNIKYLFILSILTILFVTISISGSEIIGRYELINSYDKLSNNNKINVIVKSFYMAIDYWIIGIGRGAYEGSINRYKDNGYVAWGNPENEYVQLSCDMGLIYSTIYFIIILITLFNVYKKYKSSKQIILIITILFILLNNIVDFNMEIASIGYIYYCILGILCYRNPEFNNTKPKAMHLISILFVLSIIYSLYMTDQYYDKARNKIRNMVVGDNNYINMQSDINNTIKMHRYDSMLPMIAGVKYYDIKKYDIALKYLSYSIYVEPNIAETHYYIANILSHIGKYDDALSEYNISMRLKSDSIKYMMKYNDRLLQLSNIVPDESDLNIKFILSAIEKNNSNKINEIVKESMLIFSNDPQYIYKILNIMIINNRNEEAEYIINNIDYETNNSEYIFTPIVEYYMSNNNIGGLERMIIKYNNNKIRYGIYYNLSKYYLRNNDYINTRINVNKALTYSNGNNDLVSTHKIIAIVEEKEKNYSKAINEYKIIITLDENDSSAKMRLVELNENMGNYNQSLLYLNDLIRDNQDNITYKNKYSEMINTINKIKQKVIYNSKIKKMIEQGATNE